MKYLYFLPVLLFLVVGIGQAEAYEGKVSVNTDVVDLIEGDIIKVDVFLIDVEPNVETILDLSLIEKGTGLPAEQLMSVPEWAVDDGNSLGDKVWVASFEFDTTSENLSPETTYYIKAVFEDKNGITSIFAFSPVIAETVIENEESIRESILPTREIPSWIRNVFVFYADGQIDDETLLNAIEFLVSEQIIKIK